jgi:hypothetical protein
MPITPTEAVWTLGGCGPGAGVVCIGRGLFQNRVRRDHFTRHQVLADAEVL